MIEAIIVCAQFAGGLEDCSVYEYTSPMERTPENEQLLVMHCAGIVEGMLQKEFVVTCEEYVEEAE